MKARLAKTLGTLAMGWLGGTAIAGEPMPMGSPKVSPAPLVTQAPAIPSLGATTHYAPSSHCNTCNPPAPAAGSDRCFIPPMIGDMFFGGFCAVGAGGGGIGGAGTLQARGVPITLPGNVDGKVTFNVNSLNNISGGLIATPGGTLISGNLINGQPATQASINALYAQTFGTGAVTVINPSTAIIDGVRGVYPGATYNTGSAVRSTFGGVGRPDPLSPNDIFDLDLLFDIPGGGAGGIAVCLPEPGGFSRYTRISENGFVRPTDRVFTNYNYLNGVLNGSGVNAFMVGVEKTLFEGLFSIQLNVPIYASTLSSTQFTDASNLTGGEFGNISVWFKYLAYDEDDLAICVGLGVNTPTANDVRLIDPVGNVLLHVNNEAVLLNPFIGALFTPSDDFFVQGFTQMDIDTNGNGVTVLGGGTGRLRSALLWSFGAGAGYIAYNDNSSTITSIIPMAELHYTTNLGGSTSFTSDTGVVTSRTQGINSLNFVAGTNVGFGETAYLTVGAGVPIIGGSNRQYDWQVLAQLNILFGAPR